MSVEDEITKLRADYAAALGEKDNAELLAKSAEKRMALAVAKSIPLEYQNMPPETVKENQTAVLSEGNWTTLEIARFTNKSPLWVKKTLEKKGWVFGSLKGIKTREDVTLRFIKKHGLGDLITAGTLIQALMIKANGKGKWTGEKVAELANERFGLSMRVQQGCDLLRVVEKEAVRTMFEKSEKAARANGYTDPLAFLHFPLSEENPVFTMACAHYRDLWDVSE